MLYHQKSYNLVHPGNDLKPFENWKHPKDLFHVSAGHSFTARILNLQNYCCDGLHRYSDIVRY